MSLNRAELENTLYRSHDVRRFTQDSPVLPDVWLKLADGENAWFKPIDLLLTPNQDSSPRELAKSILAAKAEDAKRPSGKKIAKAIAKRMAAQKEPRAEKLEVSMNNSYVVGKFHFDELVRVLLPLTKWWDRYVARAITEALTEALASADGGGEKKQPGGASPDHLSLSTEAARKKLIDIMWKSLGRSAFEDLAWLVEVIGRIEWERHHGGRELPKNRQERQLLLAHIGLQLLDGLPLSAAASAKSRAGDAEEEADGTTKKCPPLWLVNINRPVQMVIWRSVPAIKADAAVRVFGIKCSNLRWAVIDSGIDARHIAFRAPEGPGENAAKPVFTAQDWKNWSDRTRIIETYDFTRLRELLKASRFDEMNQGLLSGRSIEWKAIAKELLVPHKGDGVSPNSKYRPPGHRHGTHVAGILAADWRQGDTPTPPDADDLRGVCPDLQLYDFRVLDDQGRGDEFAILAALQFVRWLNGNRDELAIHGVNLSLSLLHDVANFACGRTPVCDECDRLVNSGVVVVAAAGNEGYTTYRGVGGGDMGGYRAISITDPGNADEVLTVGATHRFKPHTYGVSYFSSRGPTGDGRIKPDLVAPGEKIKSLIPGDEAETMDGTSMAAPHVSGAAALLMAKHLELMGNPRKIKKILCSTATDLGRERHFQGAGMLDVLRALQSV